jgi:hypothetical protein
MLLLLLLLLLRRLVRSSHNRLQRLAAEVLRGKVAAAAEAALDWPVSVRA